MSLIDGDQPAMPTLHIHHFQNEDADGKHDNVVPRWMGGLTKRELLAAMFSQASVMGRYASGERDLFHVSCSNIVDEGTDLADALIARLNEKPNV